MLILVSFSFSRQKYVVLILVTVCLISYITTIHGHTSSCIMSSVNEYISQLQVTTTSTKVSV